jgi:hypothetical protein
VKSKQPAVVVLLVLMQLVKKYHHRSQLARSIHAELEMK